MFHVEHRVPDVYRGVQAQAEARRVGGMVVRRISESLDVRQVRICGEPVPVRGRRAGSGRASMPPPLLQRLVDAVQGAERSGTARSDRIAPVIGKWEVMS